MTRSFFPAAQARRKPLLVVLYGTSVITVAGKGRVDG